MVPHIGHVEEAVGILDGMEESLHTNVRIVVMWNSILRSKEMNMLIKAGLIFLILGGLSFLGLMFVVLCFGVGGSGNPPLTGWYAVLISFIGNIGLF